MTAVTAPKNTTEMNGYMVQFNRTRRASVREGIAQMFATLADEHGYIQVGSQMYRFDGQSIQQVAAVATSEPDSHYIRVSCGMPYEDCVKSIAIARRNMREA